MDGSIEIRPASTDDVGGIVDLFWEVASEGSWIGTEIPFDREVRATAFRETIVRPDALSLVARTSAEHGRTVAIGHLSLRPSHRVGILDLGMLVAAPYRSRGVGMRLLRDAIAWAKTTEAHKVTLEVFPHNAAAIALYERCGFEREGYLRQSLRRRNGELWDTIVMGLLLRP